MAPRTSRPEWRQAPFTSDEVSTGKVLAALKGHMEVARVMAFSPDGRLLAFVDSDSSIILWKLPRAGIRKSDSACPSNPAVSS